MYRTLSELRDSVNLLILSQGEDASCAAFIFTKHDVFEVNEDTDEEEYFSPIFTEDVLADVGSTDYIYETVHQCIDDAITYQKAKQNKK